MAKKQSGSGNSAPPRTGGFRVDARVPEAVREAMETLGAELVEVMVREPRWPAAQACCLRCRAGEPVTFGPGAAAFWHTREDGAQEACAADAIHRWWTLGPGAPK